MCRQNGGLWGHFALECRLDVGERPQDRVPVVGWVVGGERLSLAWTFDESVGRCGVLCGFRMKGFGGLCMGVG